MSFLFKSPLRKAQEELAERIKVQSYQNDPKKWLTERLGEDERLLDWSLYDGYEGHKWDGTPNPFMTAFDALAQKEWVAIESATSVGKTYFLPRVVFWFLDTYPNSLVITTAPKKEQLRRVLWTEIGNAFSKFKKIRPHSELFSLNLTVDKRKNEIAYEKNDYGIYEAKSSGSGHEAIGIVAGVGAGEESATKMQGFHRQNMLFVIEEAAGVHPAVITAIINTSTGGNNLILAVGNPDSELDALHQFAQKSKVKPIIISALDHPNIVVGKEFIPGAVTQQSIDFRKQEYGEDSPFYKSRVRGIAPTEAVDSLIKLEYFEQCLESSEKFKGIEQNNLFYYDAVGVDAANSESGDMGAVCFGRGNRCEFLKEFVCQNATHLAYNLIFDDVELSKRGYRNYGLPKIKDYDILPETIGVDSVGIGVSTVNAFHDEGYKCISLMGGQMEYAIRTGQQGEDLYRFASLRSQMYFEAREDLRMCEVIIGIKDERILRQLRKELITIKYKVQGGKIQVEEKEVLKKRLGGKSPNLADAFVYWNWMRKGYYLRGKHLPFA